MLVRNVIGAAFLCVYAFKIVQELYKTAGCCLSKFKFLFPIAEIVRDEGGIKQKADSHEDGG